MARDLIAVYTESVHDSLRQYASWPIGMEINLGDYGRLEGNLFIKQNDITKKFGINVAEAKSDVDVMFEFKSAGIEELRIQAGTSINPSVGGGAPVNVRASTKVNFVQGETVYFWSIKLTHYCIDNITDVNENIMNAFKIGDWDGKFVFVHSLFRSKGTTILVASNAGASIEVEASTDAVEQIDLADASVGLVVKSERNVGLKVIAHTGLTPLVSLSQVRPKIRWLAWLGLGDKTVQPLLAAPLDEAKSAPLPGHIISSLSPEISPSIAQDLGKEVEDVFQVVEIA